MASRSPEALAALAETLGGLTFRRVQGVQAARGLPKLGMPWFSEHQHGNSCPCKECDATGQVPAGPTLPVMDWRPTPANDSQ